MTALIEQLISNYLEDYLNGKRQVLKGFEQEARNLNALPIFFDMVGPGLFLIKPNRQLISLEGASDQETIKFILHDSSYCTKILRLASEYFPELVQLIPPAPPQAVACPGCDRRGYQMTTNHLGDPYRTICARCQGAGWMDPEAPGP